MLSPSGVGAFCFKRLLVIDSIFVDQAYLDYLSVFKLRYIMCFRIGLFLLVGQICRHGVFIVPLLSF